MAKKKEDPKQDVSILKFKIKSVCKNSKQKELVKCIQDHEISFALGISGSGKSFVSLMTALRLLKDPENPYQKIVLVYPVELNSEENLGFLKGTLKEKLEPYSEVDLYTIEKIINESGQNGKEVTRKLRETGQIEIRTAAFLRGATLDNSIVIISEAQTDSKYIFNADEDQVDATSIKKGRAIPGLQWATKRLAELPEVGICRFGPGDVVRNPVIEKIIALWKEEQ